MSKDQNILRIVIFNEFWNRMTCYGILTFLVLHLSTFFQFSDNKSYTYYGMFTALSFGSTLLGGIFADRLVGAKLAIILGGFFLIVGNLFLLFHNIIPFFLGLGCIIIGMGLSRGNSQSLIAIAYRQSTVSIRENAFTLFYAWMNIGSMLGPIVMGISTKFLNWQWGFLINVCGICCGLSYFCTRFNILSENRKNQRWCTKKQILRLFSLFCFTLVIVFAFLHVYFFYLILTATFFFGLYTFARLFFKADEENNHKIYIIFLLNIFCICFFASSLQLGSSVTMFLSHNIHQMSGIYFLPANIFNALNPLFVALMAPLFMLLWKYLKKRGITLAVWNKIAIGFALASLGFLALLCITKINSSHVFDGIALIVLSTFFLGAAEVCLSPAILAAIGQLAPRNSQGTIMGLWYFSLAFAGYLSGNIAKLAATGQTISYAHEFEFILILNGILAILIYSIPKIKLALAVGTNKLAVSLSCAKYSAGKDGTS